MAGLIRCPKCGIEFEPTDAMRHEVERQVRQDLNQQFLEVVDAEKKKIAQQAKDAEHNLRARIREKDTVIKDYQLRETQLSEKEEQLQAKEQALERELNKRVEDKLGPIRERIQQEAADNASLQIMDLEVQLQELNEKRKQADENQLETLRQLRAAKEEAEHSRIEADRRIEQAKIETAETIRAEEQEQAALQAQAKNNYIVALKRQVDELKRKLDQTSQQAQGEALETSLQEILELAFPTDEINPVPKGEEGADVVQTVRDTGGQVAGRIVWEAKATKGWSDKWLAKVKKDALEANADVCVIVSTAMPKDLKDAGELDGVWVTGYKTVQPVAQLLRQGVLAVAAVRASMQGQGDKVGQLIKYFAGPEFKRKMAAIVDAFRAMREDINKEKRLMMTQWKKREKLLEDVLGSTTSMYGELQAMLGKQLAPVDELELPAPIQEGIPELNSVEEEMSDQELTESEDLPY